MLVATIAAGAQVSAPRNGELVADGAWSWFQDPRAIHLVGARNRTYIGYVTSVGDVDVVSQDAGTALLTHTTLHAGLQADDHASPGLAVLPDRRIVVFYSKHGGTQMLYRISVHGEDITAFGPEHSLPTNTGTRGVYCYGNPVYLAAEHRLYLFFRGGDSRPAMTWTHDYLHWSHAVDVVIPDHQPAYTRPYVKYTSNGVDTIRFAFTDGHPREVRTNSLYSMTYEAGVLSAPDGTPLSVLDSTDTGAAHTVIAGVPHKGAMHTDWLRPSAADPAGNGGLVYNGAASTGPAWVESIAHASNGAPAIVYATYGNLADAKYRYARWNGTGWTKSLIVGAGGSIDTDPNEPQYSGGADLDHNDPATVYLSRETSPGSADWEVARWHTADGGATWGVPTAITQHSPVKNIRPVAPTGPPGEVRVVWMSGRYTGYRLGGYGTQLREWTTGLAPTTARISESAHTIRAGSPVVISGRIVQGYKGSPVPYAIVELIGHTAGRPDQLLQRVRADKSGLAKFTRRPSTSMRFFVHVRATSIWGGSTSPSIVVVVS
jgi:hypothetical protein